MTTTRMDHTDCSHETSPVARRACRTRRRNNIRDLQKAYMEVAGSPNFEGQREYEASVEIFAMDWGMDLVDAYNLIENGPVII